MARSKLNDKQKARAVELVSQGVKQSDVASYFNVSPRTINRVLDENGMIHTRRTLSDQEKDFLKLMAEANLSVPEVRERLVQPPLTPRNIISVVAGMDETQLGQFLFSVMRTRMLREHQEREAAKAMARASNGEMQQEVLYG